MTTGPSKPLERLDGIVQGSTAASRGLFAPLLDRLAPVREPEQADWAAEADWALLQQEPLRARRLLWVTLVLIALLVVWAAVGKVDEVTRGDARVVPTTQVQVLQSVDGGVVEALLAKEGQVVEAGQC